jgi:hypothetical protein
MLALVLWATPVKAQGPAACAEGERADVCELKIQRNNAFDQIAIEKRKQELMTDAEKKLDRFWKEWVDGDVAKADWWSNLWARLSGRSVVKR